MDENEQHFNQAADITYGLICCLCFFFGTLGNLSSFIYFRSKKRDISNVIYMMITINDAAISLTVLPVGISFFSDRKPGILFGSEYGCAAWVYVWNIAVTISIILVMCLSISRTISLLRPFKLQKVRHLILAVVLCCVILLVVMIAFNKQKGMKVLFSHLCARCDFVFGLSDTPTEGALLALEVFRNLTYVAPTFVVATSCAISAILLTRKKEHVEQKDLQRSRNRATVTILLFAVLYGVCNIPKAVDFILATYSRHTDNIMWYFQLYQFGTQYYYYNAMHTLLIAANSAANPIIYFWRMPPLREGTLSSMRKSLRVNKVQPEVRGESLSKHSRSKQPTVTTIETVKI